jgi:hypothetical protein
MKKRFSLFDSQEIMREQEDERLARQLFVKEIQLLAMQQSDFVPESESKSLSNFTIL